MTWGITEGCGRVVPSPLYLRGGGAGHGLGHHRGVWPGGDDVVGLNVLSCRADIIIRGNAGSTVLIWHRFTEFSEFRSCVKSRGGRPGLSVLMSLTVSVDVKQH